MFGHGRVALTLLCCELACSSGSARADERPPDTAAKQTTAAGSRKVPDAVRTLAVDRSEPAGTDAPEATVHPDSSASRPCDLLRAAMVAEVAGVKVSALTKRQVSNTCAYSWPAGSASILFVRVDATAAHGRERFESGPRPASGDAPVLEPVPELTGHVDRVRFESTRFENVVGELTLVDYANRLDAVSDNLSFSITYAKNHPPGVAGESHRAETIALTRAVLAGLSPGE